MYSVVLFGVFPNLPLTLSSSFFSLVPLMMVPNLLPNVLCCVLHLFRKDELVTLRLIVSHLPFSPPSNFHPPASSISSLLFCSSYSSLTWEDLPLFYFPLYLFQFPDTPRHPPQRLCPALPRWCSRLLLSLSLTNHLTDIWIKSKPQIHLPAEAREVMKIRVKARSKG